MVKPVHVVGGGLAGSEAAWQLASAGVPVVLHEMRPLRRTEAHQTGAFAELVCSNSFRSDDWASNAVGLVHEEMRRAGSLIMDAADRHKLPAGGALAVDREGFAGEVTRRLEDQSLVGIMREEVSALPPADWDSVIVATGPLTSPSLARAVQSLTGEAELAFFDAIAPIVHRDSIDMSVCWLQSRYDKEGPGGGTADYINCPLDKAQYDTFIDALISGEKTSFKEWEASTPYFEGCLPIEVMAERGRETLAYGPMKPVGLTNPHRPERPYAVVQLRQDNALRRLLPVATGRGLLSDDERRAAERRLRREEDVLARAESAVIAPDVANPILLDAGTSAIQEPHRVALLARRPGVPIAALLGATGESVEHGDSEWANIELKYAGYLSRERAAAGRLAQLDGFVLPAGIDYHALGTLSFEAREKLNAARPTSLGQDGRIPGVSPSDLQSLVMEVMRRRVGSTTRFT